MDLFLLRHGHVAEAMSVDPDNASLSPRGVTEAEALARACLGWDIQFLCTSTAVRAEQTADIIQRSLPNVLRWDLKELEALSVDDMEGQVILSSRSKRWTPEQYRFGIERTWVRVVAVLARIEIYCATYHLDRVALLTHADVINLCLYNWLGLDWTVHDKLEFLVGTGASCHLTIQDGKAQVDWINRL